MLSFLFVLFFVLGSCVGSFAAYTLQGDTKRSFWSGRSRCEGCKKVLRWFELIPIVSYILQRGKCRKCAVSIPSRLLGIEFLYAFLWGIFGIVFIIGGFSLSQILLHLVLLSGMIGLAIDDGQRGIIDDRFSLPCIGIGIIGIGVNSFLSGPTLLPSLSEALFGAIIGMLFYSLQIIIPGLIALLCSRKYTNILPLILSPGLLIGWIVVKIFRGESVADRIFPSLEKLEKLPAWVGGGDIRLGIFFGLVLGWQNFIVAVMIGYICGTLLYLIHRIFIKREIRTLPVAPLLAIGWMVVWISLIFN